MYVCVSVCVCVCEDYHHDITLILRVIDKEDAQMAVRYFQTICYDSRPHVMRVHVMIPGPQVKTMHHASPYLPS